MFRSRSSPMLQGVPRGPPIHRACSGSRFLCRIVNCGQLAFYDVRTRIGPQERSSSWPSNGRGSWPILPFGFPLHVGWCMSGFVAATAAVERMICSSDPKTVAAKASYNPLLAEGRGNR
jgi:hypothetical protein